MPKARGSPLVVLSIGGSVFRTGEGDAVYLRKLSSLLHEVATSHRLLVTVGGGRTAREYIALGRELGLTPIELDELGIEVTRIHARLLASLLGPPVSPAPATTLAEAVREAHRGGIVVLGGTEPGHTTDGVAALLAARLRADRVVNATSVSGLFDKDPRRERSAKRIERCDWAELRAHISSVGRGAPGQQFVFDALGVDLLARSKIPLWIVDGRDLDQLEAALLGRPFIGTRVE
jgi:uridylate kinase